MEILRSLIHAGADTTCKDVYGLEPQDYTSEPSIKQYLRRREERIDALYLSNVSTPSSTSSPDSQVRQYMSEEQKNKHQRSGSLNQIIQEATRQASREPRHGGLGSIGNGVNEMDNAIEVCTKSLGQEGFLSEKGSYNSGP